MIIHNDANFTIFFGDATHAFVPSKFYGFEHTKDLFSYEPFTHIKKLLHLDDLIFSKQVHGADGLLVSEREQCVDLKPFFIEGDFIITTVSSIGLGQATADCLPIILYDSFSHCVAIIHAGWRGSLKKVALAALNMMVEQCGAHLQSIKVFFGPSAKICCYQVGGELLTELEQFSFVDNVLIKHDDGYYFDMPQFNKILLLDAGIKKEAFHMQYNLCTICDESFCSYRRSKGAPERQMTVVVLK